MKQYSSFIFESVFLDREAHVIRLRYALDHELQFEEKITLPKNRKLPESLSREQERLLFFLHIMGGISYYKTCCPKNIIVCGGTLSPSEAKFFETVYEKGLGEFAYKNTLDLRNHIHFPVSAEEREAETSDEGTPEKGNILIPVGGGKDSTVTAELLKETGRACTLFRVGSHPFITNLAEEMELPLLTVERSLPALLFKLNAEGALNGHVPITGYMNALTAVLASLYGFETVAFSNERSSNEGNLEYLGSVINHQWSKSIEFERGFVELLKKNCRNHVQVFSLLRPLSELSIAKHFCKIEKYRESITSCNANWKILGKRQDDRWCKKCPKCLFSFILFAAFLEKEELIRMFGGNLLYDAALLPLFKEIVGLEGTKPFECVGSPDEAKAALALANDRGEFEDSALMRTFARDVLPTLDTKTLLDTCFKPSDDHLVPSSLLPLLA